MPYSSLSPVSSGQTIDPAWGNQVDANFDAAFPLGVDTWTAWTPTLTQTATVTKTVNYAKYQRVGRSIWWQVDLSVTGAGTAGATVLLGLPVGAAHTTSNMAIGSGKIIDASATQIYVVEAALTAGGTTVQFYVTQTSFSAFGASPAVTLASGDVIRVHGMFEAAT